MEKHLAEIAPHLSWGAEEMITMLNRIVRARPSMKRGE